MGRRVEWAEGTWTHAPVATVEHDGDLDVTAASGSDAWRLTSYGFVHDSEHALTAPFEDGSAVEVEFTAGLTEQFDQAGVFVRAGADHWVKTGVEFADGVPQVGAVVTAPQSDWSVAPCPDWAGQRVRVRVSWADGALTMRAGLANGPLQLVRVAPFLPRSAVTAGPFVCAPTRAGLTVRFHAWTVGPADLALHGDGD
ncbi:DUF1349 domain-containing protein [Curtobacterium sp. RRHDQ10]|uniref:DUF1349 domain-containing protein n=1 Tax=Curtobacterium phyllosphaerae TaxID=3413379 RepID=UPI003BF31FE2